MSDVRVVPKQKRGIDSRTHIIEAANVVYERKGRDYFKTQDVQKESGMSIGSIYRYFKDRVTLLDAVMAYRVEQGLEDAPAAPVAAPAEDSVARETIQAIKDWCEMVIVKGEGAYDLKTAGEFILKEIEERGL